MSKVKLTKWGNSMGIRIPAIIIDEAHLRSGEELKIAVNKKGNVMLMPIRNPQAGWLAAFNAAADVKGDDVLLDVANTFDEEEWKW